MPPMYGNIRLNSDQQQTLRPGTRTATATGIAVNLLSCNETAVQFNLGAWTDGTHTYTIMEAPNVNGAPGTFTAVDISDLDAEDGLLNGSGQLVVSSAPGGNRIKIVTYLGGKGWLRVDITVASATTGAVGSATVINTMLRNVGNTPANSSAAF